MQSRVILAIFSQFNELNPNPIIFLLIALSVIAFQFFLYEIDDETELNHVTMGMSLFSQGILAIASLYMVKRHYHTQVFGKSYIFLFTGVMLVLVGDVVYNILLLFDYDPFPSISDIFFFGFYLFMSLYLYMIIRNFKKSLDRKDAAIMFSAIMITVLAYSILTYSEIHEFNFDFYYCILFVFGSATVVGFAIIGVRTLRSIPLGRSWMIIVVGILIGVISDVWFCYASTSGFFTLSHESNQLWNVSYFVILYGLYKTTKAT